jgi:tetratricopeptide (TPR) repeat protein
MKLGELLFRRGDFAAARVELESLARKFHNTPFHSPSLFLAAQSAARIPDATSQGDAMLLLEEIASKPGDFAHRARLEQANLLAAQHRPQEANLILDKILSTNPDSQIKATALIEKGKNFFVLGNEDPANTRAAIEIWKQVAGEKTWDPVWRNQALARIGTAYEKIGDADAAVANYYEVFKPSASAPKEFFWFHKAGFSAGRILEAQKKWKEAIRVYEIMATSEGPRAVEAKNRIQKLRLENFIWDGN